LGDNDPTKALIKSELEKRGKLPPHMHSILTLNSFFQNFYTLFKRVDHGFDVHKPKRNLLIRFKEMFDSADYDSSILIYSGPATPKGTIPLEVEEVGLEELDFNEILTEWKKRTSNQKFLLIILDCNYSGKWVAQFNQSKEKIEDVFIFASCQHNQKNQYFELGTYFSFNMFKVFNKVQADSLLPTATDPLIAGNFLNCKKYTNLYFNFNSWQSISMFQKSDYVTIEYDNGSYWGHMVGGQKQFWGMFTWKAGSFKGSKYTGEFDKGKLHGKGIMFYNNGRVYEGDFISNAPDGAGIETYDNGDRYVGKFSKGFKNGRGVYYYKFGDKYEGNFAENKPNGIGTLTMAKGAKYVGSFHHGKCNGKGEYKYENGDVYTGDWVDSVKHGQGVYKYSNGDVYTGQFINGIRHGKGKLVFVSEEIYEGGWEKDMMSGQGKYITREEVQLGEWINGKMSKDPSFFSKEGTQKIDVSI